MTQEELLRQIREAAAALGADDADIQLERPRNPEHGDAATNAAMVIAKRLRRPPRQIAQELIDRLDLGTAGVEDAGVAGPGFINFRFAHELVAGALATILEQGSSFGRSIGGSGRSVQVEFVSANPTGPLHVAHGRGAALGDAIASLLLWTGHAVEREFYVNDAGVQIDKLGESLDVRWRQRRGEAAEIPENGYHGEYLVELAREVELEHGAALAGMDGSERIIFLRDYAVAALLEGQKRDLADFGVRFDHFYLESSLYREGRIEETLAELAERGLSYESEGALWFRTTEFGDDKDRVLRKSDGSFTYFLPDLAYHRDKARRGFDHAIDIWGADHHGYVPRMQAALAALGLPGFLDVEIVQLVRITRAGREVRLSKRSGDFVTLRELFEETGADVARYFFLMRRGEAQMLFDLDLALDQSEKNPVYKIQYAHARMMSIFARAGASPDGLHPDTDSLALLRDPAERELIRQLGELPEAIERAAAARAPHLLCDYLEATAGMVNSWYHAGNPTRNPELAVLTDDARLREARLALAAGVRVVLRNGLELLGLGAPERMERESGA